MSLQLESNENTENIKTTACKIVFSDLSQFCCLSLFLKCLKRYDVIVENNF